MYSTDKSGLVLNGIDSDAERTIIMVVYFPQLDNPACLFGEFTDNGDGTHSEDGNILLSYRKEYFSININGSGALTAFTSIVP